jgi:hypothetical protein
MNVPYFAAEDRLMALAAEYDGSWNAQIGFEYRSFSHRSSSQALLAVDAGSPFRAQFRDQVLPQVSREQPQVVGLCIASVFQLIPSLQLCKALREGGYPGFIVLGGNTVSRLAQEMAIDPVFDLVDGLVTFQGEQPLLELCQVISSGGSLSRVPQLVWRDRGQIRQNPAGGGFDPGLAPTPDYTSLPVGRYWGENYLNLVAARGCYYGKCSFCAIPYGWGNGGFAGVRSPEAVCGDMLELRERHGINRFKFVDEALAPAFMRALAERILAEGLQVEWEGYVRLESAWYDDAFVDLVSRAGFRKGYFGLELLPSGGRDLLNKSDRPCPDALIKTCSSSGVKIHFFCMFGFPGTGEEEAWATVEYLLDNQDAVDTADLFPWTYAKHTQVAGAEPIVGSNNDWALELPHRPLRPGCLSSQAVAELASCCEDLIWREVPRFLHPTYRLVSPWSESLGLT